MRYMLDTNLKTAYEKSNDFLTMLNLKNDKMVSTQEVIDIVEKHFCPDIDISFGAFSDFGINEPYGAMMKVIINNESKKITNATIILNTDNDATFQRFSLLHEIGHLVMHAWDSTEELSEDNANKYVVSTHINYNITNISEKQYKDNHYLINEQLANIFALRVLMPSDQFISKMKEYKNIADVAKFFGLTEDAVLSRIRIGA